MADEFWQKIWLGIAAAGGAAMMEGVRRFVLPAEKRVDVELTRDLERDKAEFEREKSITAREEKLRQALWDELEKTMGRVDHLEKKLVEASMIINTLNETNLSLKAEVMHLTKQIELLNKGR